MANNESALNMVGLVEASDYLASLLARLAVLEQRYGVVAISPTRPRYLYFCTPLEYGAAHQLGREETHLPERLYLGLSDADHEFVLVTLEMYLQG
ncbi:phage virion morphogenesis protein [Aeromonas dhakensis]|uniref:virion morphogenesis protein n=1 Tax=Aeromonas dhakensis TaxID=196024 RepID=UPI000E3D6A7A|nr:virion morphogenesis protein [Aeromonas dhakensis]RFS27654.1 virion morphogenesis protein [Aeromonas dhakensis]